MTSTVEDTALVSVFMATYDRHNVVGRAIESVLTQTYDNFELIVVDDCSPTDPQDIISSFDTDRIKYIRHEHNKGWGAAMNTAFKHSSGSYIAMIGDDDQWRDASKLDRQVKAMENADDVGICCTGWRVVSEKIGEIKQEIRPSLPSNLECYILGQNRLIQSISALVSREAWTTVGGCDEALPRGIDSDLFRRMIFAGFDVEILPEPTIDVYVDRNDRMTAKRTPDQIRQHIEGERAKLKKFPDRLERCPSAHGRIYEKIGTHWLHTWETTGNPEHLSKGRQNLRRALEYDLTNSTAAVRLLWSGPQRVGAPSLESLVEKTLLSRLFG